MGACHAEQGNGGQKRNECRMHGSSAATHVPDGYDVCWGRFMLLRLIRRSIGSALATSAAAASLSRIQTGSAASALNATSHIVWGDSAFERDEVDASHTALGALLNFGAMVAWSTVYELLPQPRSMPSRALKAAAVSAAAYVTDYHVVPKRFTPGFEARLSPGALGAIYVALALGFLSGDDRA